ncbi:MAG: peptidase M20 [Verrucomicrobia bacterium RIFCSPLOWO2_12_FULL_64_8]|nr:MAG: peptidase M20 [Verrucomicrobia bacterium RIFCSPLOWO2_12_FULL_64_8]
MFDPIEKLQEYIRFPSVSTDPRFKEGLTGARDFIGGLLRSLGFAVEIVPTARHAIVLAHRGGGPHWPHVIIYGHYDVQPPDPLDLWQTPPFDPQVRGHRIHGRGAADNKGPLLAHVTAVGRLLEKNPRLPLRITFLIEGEEEIGSPSFLPFLEEHRGRLKGDLVFLSDTVIPRADQVVITCGLRGLVLCDVEVTGAKSDLHSGLHGGVLRNPIQALTELCASLHTPDGRVNLPGFYDDVQDVEPWEREELRKLGGDEKAYRDFLGIPDFHVPPGYTPFEAIRFLPTLEFNGIGGGYQGEGTKTVIPSKALVKISCRLVPDQAPPKIRELLHRTIRERMPKDVAFRIVDQHDGMPYGVVPPDRPNTPKDQPPLLAKAFRAADAAITEVFGRPPLYLREGGSIPIIADIKRVLGLDSVLFGLFLPEDNLHAPNESFDLRVMEKGSAVSEKVLTALAAG